MWTRRRWIAAVALGAVALPVLSACGGGNTTVGASSTASSSAAASSQPASKGSAVQIAESGSSLLYPLFNIWQPDYQKAHSNVQITTASTGSGTGISQAISGLAQIGASDAYLADAQMKANPGMLNIPLTISAQVIAYNLPGLSAKNLNLSGPVIADIYMGKVKYWDDAEIKALNAGVSLPHQAIVPITRSDGSGDTFLFTQFLTNAAPAWKSGVNPSFGTTITWPSVASEISNKGNDGVEQGLKSTPGAIGYLGISWLDKATKDGIGYASLENQAGKFVLPTTANIQAAVSAMASQVPADERQSLIFAPGDTSYPIINFEYAIVKKSQPNAATATALKDLLNWAVDTSGGNAQTYLDQVHFVALPAAIQKMSQTQINSIGS